MTKRRSHRPSRMGAITACTAFVALLIASVGTPSCIVNVKEFPDGVTSTTSSTASSEAATSGSGGGTGGAATSTSAAGGAGGQPMGVGAGGAGGSGGIGGQPPLGPTSCAGFVTTGSGGAAPNNGVTDCGPNQNEDCCTSIEVKGGTFNRMGKPIYPATLSDFRLDKFEVTVGRFRQFVAFLDSQNQSWAPKDGEGKHAHLAPGGVVESVAPSGSGGGGSGGGAPTVETGWNSNWASINPASMKLSIEACTKTNWSDAPESIESHPMNCVTWYEAYAFCIYDGGFLPTDAEWLYVSEGGSLQRQYPWGKELPTPERCRYDNSTLPVGSLPAGNSNSGHMDLCGNVAEMTLDYHWFCGAVCQYRDNNCEDCANLNGEGYFNQPSKNRLLRGGHWNIKASTNKALKNNWYESFNPNVRQAAVGWRCARTPDP